MDEAVAQPSVPIVGIVSNDTVQNTEADIGKATRSVGVPARVHLLIGPVGAGKSTYAMRLAREQAGLHLDLDDWMARLYLMDRPDEAVMAWYAERTRRCTAQILKIADGLVRVGTTVVLEIGLLRRDEREAVFARMAAQGTALCIHVLEAPRDLRRARVEQRNVQGGGTFSMVVPAHIFELASDLWEPVGDDECDGHVLQRVFSV